MTSSANTSAGRRVVVGVDRSPSARVALEHAARRAGEDGSLVVAHAMVPQLDAISGSLSGLDDEHRIDVLERVERLAADTGVQTETRIVDGAPAEALAELARETGAEEIVVGSRGLGRFAAALGSVSHALLAHADRPVAVVPRAGADLPQDTDENGGRTVVVGYDGSPEARVALEYAARRAGRNGQVVAVYAFQPAPDWLGAPYYQRALDAAQESGREVLRSLEDEQSELGVSLTTSLLEGPPARAIVAAADARDADEIVVGSRGFGRLRGVLGSVSHSVLHEADRPVVVIPAGVSA